MITILDPTTRAARATAIHQRFTPDYLAAFRQRCDPLADAAVAEIFASEARGLHPAGYTNLLTAVRDQAFADGEACLAFLRETRRVPAWVCFEDFAPGQKLFFRHGVLTFLIGVSVLVASYGGHKDNKVLTASGRLSHETAFRRAVETAHFTLACCQPDGLRENAPGFDAILQVRLLHARVRQLCRRQGYDTTRYDEPINQESMAAAIMLFSHGVIRALEVLGVSVTEEEKESYHALWRYGGYLMGVELALLPPSHAEEAALFDCVQYHYTPDADTIQLFQHTVGGIAAGATQMPLWLSLMGGSVLQSRAFLNQFVGLTVSPTLARYLEIEPHPLWRLGFQSGGRLINGYNQAQRRWPWLENMAIRSQAHLMQTIVNALLAGAPAQFTDPGALAQS